MNSPMKHILSMLILGALLTGNRLVVAAVSPEEAARLGADLTPFGAERAANPQGTIPAWTGGYTTVPPGYQSGQPRPDPFANEKPLFQITATNMAQYADKLSDGMQALFHRFPAFRIDVYPTHRTAAAPEWVYEKTRQNATRARMNGLVMEGAQGGIPYPIPKSGAEAIWNHQLAWRGESITIVYQSYIVAGGKPVQVAAAEVESQSPYYYREKSPENVSLIGLARLNMTGPAARVGENAVIEDPFDLRNRKAWTYLVGQRRIRRAPFIAYDNPDFFASGLAFHDEYALFNGSLDRYDWKLLGKKELFVPYNTQGFHKRKITEVLGPHHINPDHVRWELHRVWVVEATLAPGKRHVMPKRRFYLDEDSWQVLAADGWDANDQLWHTGYALSLLVPELPALIVNPHAIYDLRKGAYEAALLHNELPQNWVIVPRRPESYFSPSTLAGQGIR